MANGNIPLIGPPMALPFQGEDTRGHTLFEADLCPLHKLPLTVKNPQGTYIIWNSAWRSQATQSSGSQTLAQLRRILIFVLCYGVDKVALFVFVCRQ